MTRRILIGILAAMAGPVWAEGKPEDAAGLFPYWDTQRVQLGETLYAENCAACHGADLEGEADWRSRNSDGGFRAPPHDETGHTWHHPDAQLFAITKYGTETVMGGAVQSDMAGFGEILSDEEILSVLAFIKASWPEKIIARHNELNRRFEATQ